MTVIDLGAFANVRRSDVVDYVIRRNPAVWAEQRRGFTNTRLHLEWYRLAMTERRLCVIAPRDHAKALALDTPVLTPSGHRPLKDIVVGETVLCREGWTKVTAVSETFTDHDCYRVTLDDGQSFVADAGHRWITNYAWRGEQVVTTDQIAADQAARTDQRHVIDCVPSVFPEADLPLDPYLLGCWLGDGTSSRAEITSMDPEIHAAFADVFASSYRYPAGKAETVGYTGGLLRTLRIMGVLGDKHVPEAYLWGSEKQRWALLQGLMDTDGSCSKGGQAVFTSTRERLTAAVEHLVWSLGMKPKRYQTRAKIKGRDCGPVYGVSFYPTQPTFRLARKAANQRALPEGRRSKATGRSVRVERTLTVPVRCLATEHGNFLIGNGVVTHNTEVFTINMTAWRAIYEPGCWSYIFANTAEQAEALKARVDAAVQQAAPWLYPAIEQRAKYTKFANGSAVSVNGAGAAVRGAHPDYICGDDVLEEKTTLTSYQRQKTEKWWSGTVGGMAHPGTERVMPDGKTRRFAATRVTLVGTPFHESDLLMGMRKNPIYHFRRYAAEFDPARLPRPAESLAVEIAA